MKLSIHLVTWNGAKYIPYLFESLRKQTFRDFELRILDNGSSDNTVASIQKELMNGNFISTVSQEKNNLGFAGGHNKLLSVCQSEYVLLLNQDMVLEPDCLAKLVSALDHNKNIAAVTPRLMKWDFLQNSFTDIIDSLGLKVFRNRRVIDQNGGEPWHLIRSRIAHTEMVPMFGVSGALPMFRMTALRDVAFQDGSIFDPQYGSYKEDVDLAFRLQSRGYEAALVPQAVAYHDRTASGPKQLSDSAAIENKKNQSDLVRSSSYKNHLMTLYKNEYWQNAILDFPWILWYEGKKFLWFLFFDRSVLGGLKEIWLLRQSLRKKRFQIKAKRKKSWQEMRKWFC